MITNLPGISVPLGAGSAAGTLRPGQTLQTLVQADSAGATFIRVGGQQVPLPAGANLTPGQSVQVTVAGKAPALQLQVAASPTAAPAPAPPADASGLVRVLAALLPKITPSLPQATAAALLPSQLPATPAALGPLLQMMLGTNDTAEGWANVLQWASRARQSGKLSGPALDAATTLANMHDVAPEDLPRLLRSLVQTSGNEAKLTNQSELPDTPDLRSSINRLMQDPAMRALLDEAGEGRAFDQAAGRTLARLDAAATANLQGLERSYAFFEIPPAWLGNANRAQVHVFGEGGGNKGGDKYAAASVVLDLDLESLGALWIQLRRDAAACACDIAADREETRELLNAHRNDLATRLNEAGLPHMLVRVHAWRVEERPARLAALLAPPRPLDASA